MKQLSENLYNRSRYRINYGLGDAIHNHISMFMRERLYQRFRVRPAIGMEGRLV